MGKISRLAVGQVESPHAPINLQKASCLAETLPNVKHTHLPLTQTVYAHRICPPCMPPVEQLVNLRLRS
ncbi:hypothetical protein BDZ89DRAFT_1058988 [Hymenopellis radicata]|nr:hypothetical protein BDZ89DRAFT_1058988 [Hymenopellis radicata]